MRLACCTVVLGLALSAEAKPRNVRPFLGCWDVSNDRVEATLVVSRPGGGADLHGVTRFKTASGTSELAFDVVTTSSLELEVFCRPRSPHGTFCRISREADGLRVRVFKMRHGEPRKGYLIESFVAQRCNSRARDTATK